MKATSKSKFQRDCSAVTGADLDGAEEMIPLISLSEIDEAPTADQEAQEGLDESIREY